MNHKLIGVLLLIWLFICGEIGWVVGEWILQNCNQHAYSLTVAVLGYASYVFMVFKTTGELPWKGKSQNA